MALSTRGKALIGVAGAVVLAVGGFVGWRMIARGESLKEIISNPIPQDVTCSMTGLEPDDDALAERPVLAIKVENNPDARPQAGLAEADIVYEEEAEGGITRFMAMYQCRDSDRVGPIRSARLVDPQLLTQYGGPLFAFAGGAPSIKNEIKGFRQIIELLETDRRAADAYERDPDRVQPHDLFASTEGLYEAAGDRGEPPADEIFPFDEDVPKGKKATEIHLNFSPTADVFWRWDRKAGVYLRSHGTEPHTLEDGSQVSATNIVVQLVERVDTPIVDPAGNPVFDFEVTGSGKAIVFRDGKVIKGRWERDSVEDLTAFVTRKGDEIALAPGTTWVELYATDRPKVEF